MNSTVLNQPRPRLFRSAGSLLFLASAAAIGFFCTKGSRNSPEPLGDELITAEQDLNRDAENDEHHIADFLVGKWVSVSGGLKMEVQGQRAYFSVHGSVDPEFADLKSVAITLGEQGGFNIGQIYYDIYWIKDDPNELSITTRRIVQGEYVWNNIDMVRGE